MSGKRKRLRTRQIGGLIIGTAALEEKDGIFIEEELGQRITEKSAKISYFVLMFIILVAVAADRMVHGTINIFLLGVLGAAMVTLPLIEFIVAKRYQ